MRWFLAAAAAVVALLPVGAGAQDTAGVGSVRGTVRTARDESVAMVAVCVPTLSRCTVTDADGRFSLTDLRSGQYTLEIVPSGSAPLSTVVEVRAGLDSAVEVVLPDADALRETVFVSAPSFVTAEEVPNSAFLVSAREVVQSAGALQDVARYVQSLPGAAIGTDDFRNDLIVRGGSPLENLYIVDNIEIPNINTFANFASAGGTVSMIDARLLQDVTLLTGGFPAAYGNRTSSVLQIALRDGDRTRVSGRATLGFAGAGGIAEGPLRGGRGSWLVSFRRSFLDLVTDDVGIGGVPVLYTINAKATYDVTPRDRVWILNVAGVDRIRLGLTEDSDLSDELSTLDIRYRGNRSATGFNWQRSFGARGVGLLGATYSQSSVRARVADLLQSGVPPAGTPVDDQIAGAATVFREDSSEDDAGVKYDLTVYAPMFGKMQGGLAMKRSQADYDLASPFGTDSPYFPVTGANAFALSARVTLDQYSGYVQSSRRFKRTHVTLGGRMDRYTYLSATTFSPRAGARYDLANGVSLNVAAGRYVQQPFALFLAAFPENRSLRPFRADHLVAGVAWTPDAHSRLTAELYHKRYESYPVSTQIPSLSLANIGDTFAVRQVLFPLSSMGTGRATGVELFAERKASAGSAWYGQANLSVSRTRHAGSEGVLRPGSYDYPVVANLVAAYRPAPRWDVSARVAYLGGRPYSPIDEAASFAERRAIYDLDRINALRAPSYFRLDVRVDRRIEVGGRAVSIFGGVQNVTNRKNVAGYSWDRRNNVQRTVEQLGIFPILGLDWEF